MSHVLVKNANVLMAAVVVADIAADATSVMAAGASATRLLGQMKRGGSEKDRPLFMHGPDFSFQSVCAQLH